MTNQTQAQDEKSQDTVALSFTAKIEPTGIYFDVGGFKEYVFMYKGESVTVTPDELFAAIHPWNGK